MKRILSIAAALVAFTSLPLAAQEANSASASQAGAASQSGATAVLLLDQSTPANRTVTNKQTGSATLKTAPGLGGLALGGGHPCAYSPATFQVSVIGGGGGIGGMKIDEACMARVAAAATGDQRYNEAANIMVAARDFDACKAYYQAGLVSDCVDNKGRSKIKPVATQQPTVSSRSAPAVETRVAYRTCSYDKAANKITMSTKFGYDSVAARSQCASALGF